jgi:hypothetical protein
MRPMRISISSGVSSANSTSAAPRSELFNEHRLLKRRPGCTRWLRE